MNSERESLRLWLEAVSPGEAQFNDTKYTLVWKLVEAYGGPPSHNDTIGLLLTKLLVAIEGGGGGVTFRLIDEAGNFLVDEAGNNLVWN